MFGLNRGQRLRRAAKTAGVTMDDIALWAILHDRDHHDLSAEMRARKEVYARVTNAGLDVVRLAFVGFLVRTGRIGDDRA